MNAPLRRAGIVVLVLFAMLFVNLNYRQVVMADSYRNNPHNPRVQTDEYQHPRGKVIISNGDAVADSVATADSLKYLRTYPQNVLYSNIVGYRPVAGAPSALEAMQNTFLNGDADSQIGDRITAAITGKQQAGGNVLLTLDKAAQETAYDQLIHNNNNVPRGAVVALDPSTGAILAAVSMPGYDPNPLASHSSATASQAYTKLIHDPNNPLLDRAFSDTYPAGSTFKVITASAAETYKGLNGSTVLTGGDSYQPPQTSQVMHNATGDVCPDQITMKQALTVSCNTAFARLAVEQVGADDLKKMAQAYGYETVPKIAGDTNNSFNVVASHTGTMEGPSGAVDPPSVAQSAIGQRDVRVTPLQEAMVAETVANGGKEMQPYLISELQNSDLSSNEKFSPKQIATPISSSVASDVQDMMESVVANGTATKAQIDGYTVGGKTGTAANGEAADDHGWFIGFTLSASSGKPLIAVAVFLQNAGKGGSAEASRIGGQIMKAYINEKGLK